MSNTTNNTFNTEILDNTDNTEILDNTNNTDNTDNTNNTTHETISYSDEETQTEPLNNTTRNKNKKNKLTYNCDKCNQKFNTIKPYQNHTLKQLCIPTNERTYCKLCNITLNSKQLFNKHLISKEHFNKITDIKVEKFDMPVNKSFLIDPYLDNNDINNLNNSNIGNGFSICFNDSTNYQVEFNKQNNNNTIEENNNNNTNDTIENKYNKELENRMQPPQPTDIQIKLLNFLKQSVGNPNIEKNFLKAINHIREIDFKNLTTIIISCEEIPILEKQKYIQTIKLYKQLLEKKLNEGLEIHNKKNIRNILDILKI